MAKEHTTIGLSRPMTATIMLVVVIAGALVVWKDRGSAEATAAATHNSIVTSHEGRITTMEFGVVTVVKDLSDFKEATVARFNTNEKAAIRIEGSQKALLRGQRAMAEQRKEDIAINREQRKEDIKVSREQRNINAQIMREMKKNISDLNAYLKSIETIE